MTTDKVRLRTSFMDDYLFFKSSIFFSLCFGVTVFLVGYDSEIPQMQKWQNNQTQYRTSKFFERIFQASQKFHRDSLLEHHFVVSTVTAQGFLNGWQNLTKESEC